MKDTKYIYASFMKLDPKDAGDVDEDLTYSDDEKALDNYVKKLQKSDKKKFDDGEAVKVYLHELNSDGVPVPVRCIEITKTEDDKGYSSEQVEEYDLPDDFKPYGEKNDSEKSDESDDAEDKESSDEKDDSDEDDDEETEAEEAAILTDIGYNALLEAGIINESWYLFHQPQEDKEKVKEIEKLRDYKYTHLDDLKEKGIPVVGKKTLKRARDCDKWMAKDLAGYNHWKATTHQDYPNKETRDRWERTDHLQEYFDRDNTKANKRIVERAYRHDRRLAKQRALELKKLKDSRAAAERKKEMDAKKEQFKNKLNDVKKKAYDKIGGGSHKDGKPVTEAMDYAAFLIGNIYPYEATSFEEFVSELDENMGILLESATELDDLDKKALAITETYVQEATLSFKNRKKLSDDDFGVPSKRKFPLNDKAHVKAAIQRFNYVDSEDERELAKRIIQRMKDFNMMNDVHVGEDNRFKKYLDSEYKDFKESFDIFPFPVAREFSVGAMLPMMGNTKGWGTPLANDSIENVVDRTNAEINNGAVFYNSNDMINDSGISMTDGIIKMESVIPHKNLIFDSEVAKLVKSISDYIDNPKNKFMEDILKKSLNFRKNIYNIKLKDDKSGNDANKVINKIKSAGFRDLDDQGVKAVYEKEVQNLIITLTYDTVADRIRVTYEEKEETGKATKESVEVIVEGWYDKPFTSYDIKYARNVMARYLSKYPSLKDSMDLDCALDTLGTDGGTTIAILEYPGNDLHRIDKEIARYLNEVNVELTTFGYSVYVDPDDNEEVFFFLTKAKRYTPYRESVMTESPDYNRLLSDLEVARDDATYIINNAPGLNPREKKVRLAEVERNYNQVKSSITRRSLGTNFFGALGRKLDSNGSYSRVLINKVITPGMLLNDMERVGSAAAAAAAASTVFTPSEYRTIATDAPAATASVIATLRLAKASETMNNLRNERHEKLGIDDDVFESVAMEASKEDIDPDITDVINKLNKLGYTTKYSCSGHTKSRIKEDGYRNGIYHGALYTTARIVFADDYKLNPPKGWKKKTFDGKIGFYPEIKQYDYSQGVPDDAFDEWKKDYMASLRDWVDKLDKKPGPDEDSKSKEN